MADIQLDGETHVIKCSEFHVTEPLIELAKKNPVIPEESFSFKQFSDKEDMPVQTFEFSAENNGLEYGNDPSIVQKEYGTIANKGVLQSWTGQSSGVRPFDPTGAAGPNHYIQMINGNNGSMYKIWSKTGSVVANGYLSDFWTSNDAYGDPIVLYDKAADRWFLAEFDDGSNNEIYIAISATSDPTGSWYAYTFSSPDFPDYLKFSAWQDGYYMTANYAEKVFAFNRDKMLAGDGSAEAVYRTFSPPTGGFFVPLTADASDGVMPGDGTPCSIFSYQDNAWSSASTDAVNIYNASVTWGASPNMTITSVATLPTNSFDASYNNSWNDIPQPTTTQKLDGIGGAMMFRAQWKTWTGYNTVLLSWAVKISSSQRGIFWCELRQDQSTDAWSIYQQGIYAPGSEYYWMSSLAMNDLGDIALCYAKGSSTTSMSLAFAGRHASDPLGTMPIQEFVVQQGSGYQSSHNRDGDYSHTCLDPDGVTFWHTGEYMNAVNSVRTKVYSFQLPAECEEPTTVASNFSTSSITTATMTLNWTRGDGDGVIVIAKEGSAVDVVPNIGQEYNDVSYFGYGDEIGDGNFVVYDGTESSVSLTGLIAETTYYFSVFEYNSPDFCYNTTGLTGDATTAAPAGIFSNSIDLGVKIYPNPSNGEFVIDFDCFTNPLEIQLTDLTGRIVYNGYLTEKYNQINIGKQEAGVYLLNLQNSNTNEIVKIIIK